MLKSIKDVLMDYVLIGFVFGTLSVVWTREPLSTADKIKKVVASMTLSLIVGSICKGLDVMIIQSSPSSAELAALHASFLMP